MIRNLLLGPFVLVLIGCASATTPSAPTDADPAVDDAPGTADAPDAPPDANNCAVQPCAIVPQCGCGAQQSCDIDGTDLDGSACRAVTTPGQETATCNSPGDCDRGYVCLGNGTGRSCRKYCGTTADCVAPRGQCVVDIVNGSAPIPGAPPVCSSGCDPTNVAAGGCPANWKCGVYTATHASTTYNIADCSPSVGAGAQGAACETANVGDDALCAANFLCTTVDAGVNNNCRKICDRAVAGACGALTCIAFAPPLTIGAVEYGVCN